MFHLTASEEGFLFNLVLITKKSLSCLTRVLSDTLENPIYLDAAGMSNTIVGLSLERNFFRLTFSPLSFFQNGGRKGKGGGKERERDQKANFNRCLTKVRLPSKWNSGDESNQLCLAFDLSKIHLALFSFAIMLQFVSDIMAKMNCLQFDGLGCFALFLFQINSFCKTLTSTSGVGQGGGV